jgi:hypothetical protein
MASPLVQCLRRSVWLVALMAMVGCGPKWTIVKQSGPPSALKTVSAVSVTFSYAGLMVGGGAGDKPEAQWVAEKNVEEPGYEATWLDLKSKWEAAYMEGLAKTSPVPVTRSVAGTPPPGGAVELVVVMNRLQLGKYMVVAAKQTILDATHSFQMNGVAVDEIQTHYGLTPSMYSPSIFQHANKLGNLSGNAAGKYIGKAR